MISGQETGKRISELILQVTAELNGSVKMAQEKCPADEFFTYRRAVGSIMGEIF